MVGLLRVSGGFSCDAIARQLFPESSPRVRRFFLRMGGKNALVIVFSACPEVFLRLSGHICAVTSLLRVSGGFSKRIKLAL